MEIWEKENDGRIFELHFLEAILGIFLTCVQNCASKYIQKQLFLMTHLDICLFVDQK